MNAYCEHKIENGYGECVNPTKEQKTSGGRQWVFNAEIISRTWRRSTDGP